MGEGTVRVRLDLAYDGAAFAGWARQPGLRTVQGELEAALATVCRRPADDPPALTVAGRTDAGVHATGQVAHVDLEPHELAAATRSRDVADLARRLTGLLARPGDLVVHRSAAAPAGFDARFSATSRRYRYAVADSLAARDPLERHRVLAWPRTLDEGAMTQAAAALTGLHDFAAFCRPRPGATTIRTLLRFDWSRRPDGVLVADVVADAFCHSMVRALVGHALAVGERRLAAADASRVLADGRRGAGFAVAPAHALTLVEVGYPPDTGLAAQAERARARREVAETPGSGYPRPVRP